MKILNWELRRITNYAPVKYVGNTDEFRTRSATQRYTFGNVQVNIYSPFDDRLGRTTWRFSLIKLVKDEETGEIGSRRSFEMEDIDDLRAAVERAAMYIDRAQKL